ncbi:unannotated protein [freshwater metagenome]|uniref:Unannotated protein n=1 Tax=freshwater metagenome TaxID=449393 RepID=A0A6J7FC72_9ZZZZ
MQTQAAQVAQGNGGGLHVAHQRRLGDLQPERVGKDTRLGEGLGHDIVETGIDELTNRHIDRDGHIGQRWHVGLPQSELRQRCAQDRRTNITNEPGFFGHRQELIGTEQTAIRVPPAGQHLEAREMPGRKIDDGLVVRNDLASLEAVAQLTRRAQREHRRLMRAGSERLHTVATTRLCPIHRCVCVTQELLGSHPRSISECNADAAADVELGILHDQRLRDRLPESFGHIGGGQIELQAIKHHDELITTEATKHVSVTHHRAQPLAHATQQLVTNGVAETVVDHLEIVEVDEQHRNRPQLSAIEPTPQLFEEMGSVG